MSTSSTVYILECAEGKYYIGKTDRPLEDRITEHFYGYGSVWTQRYRPLTLIQIISNADSFDEDKYTKMTMKKYGIDNVRGGSYCQMILNIHQQECLVLNWLLPPIYAFIVIKKDILLENVLIVIM